MQPNQKENKMNKMKIGKHPGQRHTNSLSVSSIHSNNPHIFQEPHNNPIQKKPYYLPTTKMDSDDDLSD